MDYYKKWTWNELIFLLLLALVFIPIFIEYFLQQYLEELLQNALYSGTLTGFIMSIIFTLGVYFIAIKPKKLTWHAIGLSSFPRHNWLFIVKWSIILIVVSVGILIAIDWIFDISSNNAKTESVQSNLTFFNILIAFVSAAIISPIYEEIFYRGFLYTWFRRWGVFWAIIISSTIFMLVHIPTFNTLPLNFVSGVVFCWVYEKTESIIPSMIVHGVFNGVAVLLTVTS